MCPSEYTDEWKYSIKLHTGLVLKGRVRAEEYVLACHATVAKFWKEMEASEFGKVDVVSFGLERVKNK